MKIKSAGITDDCVVEYTWTDDVVSWSLVSSSSRRAQDASYTVTPEGDKTRVKFKLDRRPGDPYSRLRDEAGRQGRDEQRRRTGCATASSP